MNLTSLSTPTLNQSKCTYDVLVENEPNGLVSATVIGLPDCRTTAATKEEALTNIRESLTARLAKAEVVTLEIELPSSEHPWMKMAGKYKDDPQFEQMLAYIEADRRELDAEMEAYYRQLDAEDQAK